MKKKYEKTNKQYQKAIKTIPLATQTTSKSAANFVKGAYPLFLEKGKGGEVWDLSLIHISEPTSPETIAYAQ